MMSTSLLKVCPKCGQVHLTDPPSRFCEKCYVGFVIKDVKINEYYCPACNRSFTSLIELRYHLETSLRCRGEIEW